MFLSSAAVAPPAPMYPFIFCSRYLPVDTDLIAILGPFHSILNFSESPSTFSLETWTAPSTTDQNLPLQPLMDQTSSPTAPCGST